MTPGEGSAVQLSLVVAALATVSALPLAVWVGFALARMPAGWRRTLLQAVVMTPLVLPPVVTGYGLLLLLGPTGPLEPLWTTVGVSPAFTMAAAVIASAVVGFPLFVRAVRQSVEAVDPGLEQAARTLGASPLRASWTVTLPLAMPGLWTGALLCFARSLGEFGATIVFAGNIEGSTRTLPLAIYRWLQVPGGEGPALRLAAVSVVLAVVAVILSEWTERRSS